MAELALWLALVVILIITSVIALRFMAGVAGYRVPSLAEAATAVALLIAVAGVFPAA